MVPRAIHASKPTDIKQEKGKEDQKKETTMNNDDFRKFLSRWWKDFFKDFEAECRSSFAVHMLAAEAARKALC